MATVRQGMCTYYMYLVKDEAGRCWGPFKNDVNISENVDDSYLYKSGDKGEGLKVSKNW